MSSQRNEYSYASQFVGKRRAESDRIPVHVNTRLRMMTDETAREVRENKSPEHVVAPKYVFSSQGDLPLHPSLLAMGRHCFTW